MDWHRKYDTLKEGLLAEDRDLKKIKQRLKNQEIETPSWGYSNAGTRFMTFEEPEAAANVYQRLEDAAQVHKYTGICPSVALHIPWDEVEDYGALKDRAEELGLELGSINPNLFEDYDYKLGSLTNPDPSIRKKALKHVFECVEIMEETGSEALSFWLPDGTNYPGQGDFRRRKAWLEEALKDTYAALPQGGRLLIEYKYFEPGFYHTDIADWGMANHFARTLGERAQVLVDLGHHFKGTNIEHIVAFLLEEGQLGGFHFNNKKYADDDLTTGSIKPYQVFLIYNELVKEEEQGEKEPEIAYMIDQMHIVKPKIEAMIQSAVNIQRSYAKALLVDREELERAQAEGDAVRCEEILKEAYETNVDPLLMKVREEMELDPRPLEAFRKSGYREKIARERAV